MEKETPDHTLAISSPALAKSSKEVVRKHLLANDYGDMCSQNPSINIESKRAAVLVPLFFIGDEVHVLLTVRSKRLRTAPGEVAFPGGKRDEGDQDDIAAALRESQEEIGLGKEDVEIISRIPPLISRHNMLVTPVIAFIKDDFIKRIHRNADEVDDVFSVPLRSFLQQKNHFVKETFWPGRFYFIHFFQHAQREKNAPGTFGLTAYVCIVVACIVYQRKPDFPMEKSFDWQDLSKPFVVGYLVNRTNMFMDYGITAMKAKRREILSNIRSKKAKL